MRRGPQEFTCESYYCAIAKSGERRMEAELASGTCLLCRFFLFVGNDWVIEHVHAAAERGVRLE